MMMLPNGKILLAGYTLTIGQGGFTLAQYKKDGILDSSFGSNGICACFSLLQLWKISCRSENGKIVMAGFFGYSNLQKLELMRFTSHGNLDSFLWYKWRSIFSLQSDFTSATSLLINASFAPVVTLEKNGKIVVAGNGKNKFAVVRYNGDPVRGNHFSDNIISNQVLTTLLQLMYFQIR
jgi:uncharacterized delta-60 repeat protein